MRAIYCNGMLFMTPPKEQGIRKGDTLPLRDGFYTVNFFYFFFF